MNEKVHFRHRIPELVTVVTNWSPTCVLLNLRSGPGNLCDPLNALTQNLASFYFLRRPKHYHIAENVYRVFLKVKKRFRFHQSHI